MKLIAIISAWSDTKELLPFCVNNIRPIVDKVLVVYSTVSNRGNKDDSISELVFSNLPCQWLNVEPVTGASCHDNETMKRNYGLKIAKEQGFSHFLIMDADEFYIQSEVESEKERIEKENLNGLVCPLKVYIKSPTLWCEDHTLVPFIHKLYHNTQVGSYKHYPFTTDQDGHVHIDPSRRVNCFDRIQMSAIFMHHFSYVRKDIDLKINNSSARLDRSRQTIYDELRDAKEGYESKLYHKILKRSENLFSIEI